MLCYVMLCYVMLCYVMLCYVMLCYVMLCYVMLCYVMLCYVMLRYYVAFLLAMVAANRPFATGGHMVRNPKYWRAKECDKTPLGNENKDKSHFSS